MPISKKNFRRVLFIHPRKFGDTLMSIGVIEAFSQAFPDDHISVLTRPEFAQLYKNNPHVASLIFTQFPLGGSATDKIRSLRFLLPKIISLWFKKFDVVIHNSGDLRENIIGWLIGGRRTRGIYWADNHPLRNESRGGFDGLVGQTTLVSADDVSFYTAMRKFAYGLGATTPAWPRLYSQSGEPYQHKPGGKAIGIHPFSSLECKEWPFDKWRGLVNALADRNISVVLFGAPNEYDILKTLIPENKQPSVRISVSSLPGFFAELTQLRALVCLDSFAVHAAAAIGTPRILINGSGVAALWAPPGTDVIDGGLGLACAPCQSDPTCLGTQAAYACLRQITVGRVLGRLDQAGYLENPLAVESP